MERLIIAGLVVLIIYLLYRLNRSSSRCIDFERKTDSQKQQIESLQSDNEKLNSTLSQLSAVDTSGFHAFLKSTPAFKSLCQLDNFDLVSRVQSALAAPYSGVTVHLDLYADICSESGKTYHTTLYDCTCPDYQFRKKPCKHMLYLAIQSGFLKATDIPDWKESVPRLAEFYETEKKLEELRKGIIKIKRDSSQRYPWLAKLYADYFLTYDKKIAEYLLNKKHPAYSASINVKNISAELRDVRSQCKQYEYQLHYLESLFPWLPDFYDAPPISTYNELVNSNTPDNKSSYDTYRDWLSPEEFSRLSDSEKFQLALDRYFKKPKSNWEVGRDYERYIGYLCEMDGYYVHYTGATQKLEDMGRDLLLERGRQLIVVHCKRWAEKKTIHENHIFQLFGSAIELSMKYPDKTVIPVFVTTTTCSEVARMCAKKLDVRLYENIHMKPYPCIKCNIGNNGEKIYHLPFDQQYDRVMLRAKDGDRYASTTKEAEQMGFRHAYRWHGTT